MDWSDHYHINNIQGCSGGVVVGVASESSMSMTSRESATTTNNSHNYGMYPPSLYDTSLSSKSSNSRRSPMMQQQQQHHQQQQQQQQHFSYPRSSSQPRNHQQPPQQLHSTFSVNDMNNSSIRSNSQEVTHSLSRSSPNIADIRNEYSRRYPPSSALKSYPGTTVAMSLHNKPLVTAGDPTTDLNDKDFAVQSDIETPSNNNLRLSPTSNTSNNSQDNNNNTNTTQNTYSLANTTTSSQSARLISGVERQTPRQYRYNSRYHTNNYGRSNDTHKTNFNASDRARKVNSIRNNNNNNNTTPDSNDHINDLQQQLSNLGSNYNNSTDPHGMLTRSPLQPPSLRYNDTTNIRTTATMDESMEEQTMNHHHHLSNPHANHHSHQPNDDDIHNSARIETPSPVNVKELKRQLWNDQEVLQVPSSTSSQQYHYRHHPHKVHDYASDNDNPPNRQQQQQPLSPACHPKDLDGVQNTNNGTLRITSTPAPSPVAMSLSTPVATYPRFARSLSPARPRRQSPLPVHNHTQRNGNDVHPNPKINPSSSFTATTSLRQPPPTTTTQPSTVRDHTTTSSSSLSSSGRFHSKFYEAALVARMGAKVRMATPSPSNQIQSSSLQPSFSSLLLSDVNPTRHSLFMDEQVQQKKIKQQPTPQNQPQSISNNNNDNNNNTSQTYRSRSLAAAAASNNTNFHQDETRFDEHETIYLDSNNNQEEIPHDTPTTRIQENGTTKQRLLTANPSNRGKSIEPSLLVHHHQEARGRVPSPLIQDRIRSLSQDSSSAAQKRHTIGFLQKPVAHTATIQTTPPSNSRFESSETTTIPKNASSEEQEEAPPPPSSIPAGEVRMESNGWREQSTKTSSRDERMTTSYREQQPINNSAPAATKDPNRYYPSDVQEKASTKATARLKMAKLMTKLNAVNRNNPEEALAEIDKILRQESHASSLVCRPSDPGGDGTPWQHDFAMTARRPTPPILPTHETAFINDGNDVDDGGDDYDSDVSSLTNPTYQGTAKPYYERVRIISPQNEKTFPKRLSPTWSDGISPSKSLPFNPSTSSFRRPRPSHLQNYATVPTATQDTEITEPLFVSQFEAREQESKTLPEFLENKDVDSMLQDTFDKFVMPEPQPAAPVPSQQIEKVGMKRSSPVEQTVTRSSPSLLQEPPLEPTKDAVEGKIVSRKLDKFISDKEALAKKIQVWDNLSNGMVSSETERRNSETQVGFRTPTSLTSPHPPIPKSRRHPWDGRFHDTKEDIKIRDTSMDEAIGMETEMTFRGDKHALDAADDRRNIESPQLSRSIDDLNNVEKHHFKRGRENIKERANEYLPVDPIYHIDERVVEEKKMADSDMPEFPDIPFTTSTSSDANEEAQEDTNLMFNVKKSSEDEFQSSPQYQPYSQGSRTPQPLHKEDVNAEESSWVSMPPTSFFSEFKKSLNPFAETNINQDPGKSAQAAPADRPSVFTITEEKLKDAPSKQGKFNVKQSPTRQKAAKGNRDGPPNRGPVDIDDYSFGISPIPSMDQSGEQAEIEVALTDPKKYARTKTTGTVSHKKDDVTTSCAAARSFACQTVENKEAVPREKKKGFLRAFIERKKKKATGSATVGHAASATSVAGHSTSLDSRGAKSTPQALGQYTTFAPSIQSTPAIHLMPPPPGIMDRRALTPNRDRRGNIISDKITRARSDSLERFRTPSMAQKFNRVMKLYDDDT